jgi:hypothetical protein
VDKILAEGIIFQIEEVEWIIPIVIQSKKDTIEIWVCMDCTSLNSTCVHDQFPTPFNDKCWPLTKFWEILGQV